MRHPIHRPDRCCVACHTATLREADLLFNPPASAPRPPETQEEMWRREVRLGVWGCNNRRLNKLRNNAPLHPDAGMRRTTAARFPSSESTGDFWY